MSSEDQVQPKGPAFLALRIFNIIASLGIVVMMLHILANVFTRYLFNSPLPNTLEYVSFWYLPIVAALGFVLAKHANEFIDAPLIFDKLTWGNRRVLVIMFSGLGVVVCSAYAYFTFVNEALHGLKVQTTGGVSSLPIWPVFFLLPAVFLILVAMYLMDLIKAIRGDLGVHDTADDDDPDGFIRQMDDEQRVEPTQGPNQHLGTTKKETL